MMQFFVEIMDFMLLPFFGKRKASGYKKWLALLADVVAFGLVAQIIVDLYKAYVA